jgi:hypothetical protein
MTTDLLLRFADLYEAMHTYAEDGDYDTLRDAADVVSTALGLDVSPHSEAPWIKTAALLRLRAVQPSELAAAADPAEPAAEPTPPPLPPGWKWHIHGIGAYIHTHGQPIIEAKIDKFDRMELFGNVPLPVIAAVLRRAGVA